MAKKRRNPVTLTERWRKSLAAKREAQESQEERREWQQSKEGREARQEALFAANRLAESLGLDTSDDYKKAMGEIQTVKVSPEEMKRAAQSAVNYHDIMCRTQLLEHSAITQGSDEETVSRVPWTGGTRLGQGAIPQFLDVRIGPIIEPPEEETEEGEDPEGEGEEETKEGEDPEGEGEDEPQSTSVEMFLPVAVLAGSPIGMNGVTWVDNKPLLDESHLVGADWYTIPEAKAGQDIYLTVVQSDGKITANLQDGPDGKVYCEWGTTTRQPVNVVGRTGRPSPVFTDVAFKYEEDWDDEKKTATTKLFQGMWEAGKIVHSVLLAAYDEGLGRYARVPGDPSDRLSWKPCLTEPGAGVDTCFFAGPIRFEMDDGKPYLVQRWVKFSNGVFTEVDPEVGLPTGFTDSNNPHVLPGGEGRSSYYAAKIPMIPHATDHNEGVILDLTE